MIFRQSLTASRISSATSATSPDSTRFGAGAEPCAELRFDPCPELRPDRILFDVWEDEREGDEAVATAADMRAGLGSTPGAAESGGGLSFLDRFDVVRCRGKGKLGTEPGATKNMGRVF